MISGYEKRPDGVIKQSQFFKQIQEYDSQYVEQRYNSYGELGPRMAYLRLGYLKAAWESYTVRKLNKILDVGYGNGDFLRAATDLIPQCYGNDVSGYPLPNDRCQFVDDIFANEYDVVCFFDVLEHFEDIDIIKDLKARMILISVPECHHPEDDQWFESWKHRRPDEHLYHFNKDSIIEFFRAHRYKLHTMSNIEDVIRKPTDKNSNILTATFVKQ